MIKDLKYRLVHLKNNSVNVIALFLSIILIFEIYSCYSLKCLKEKEENEMQNSLINEKSNKELKLELKDIVKELTTKNFDILGVEKNGEGYNIEVGIKGKKDEIYNNFKSLNNCKIIDYEFNAQEDNIVGKVRLTYG